MFLYIIHSDLLHFSQIMGIIIFTFINHYVAQTEWNRTSVLYDENNYIVHIFK